MEFRFREAGAGSSRRGAKRRQAEGQSSRPDQFFLKRQPLARGLTEQLRETRIRVLGNGIGKGLHFNMLVIELRLRS